MCKIPTSPFLVQKGRYEGHAIETLIFHEPAVVFDLLKKGSKELNDHIDSLFKIGEDLPTVPFCSCGQHRVKHFTIKDEKIRYDLMSCHQDECVGELIQKIGHGAIYPIKLSTLNLFRNDAKQQGKVGIFLKNVLGIGRYARPDDILGKIVENHSAKLALSA